MKKFYRYDEVAKEFSVSVRTIERWVKRKELDVVKIGGTRRVTSDEIEKKSDNHRQLPTITDTRAIKVSF